MYKSILNFIPGILTIPFYIGSFLYLILLPDITYYALGIYLDIWIPALRTFWGYPILFILLMIPFVSMILIWLLTFQSFWVLFKFLIGSYYPRDELLGFVTMYPAAVVIISYTVSYFLSKRENNSASSSSSAHIPPIPINESIPDPSTRGEESTAARAASSSDAKTRGENSTAAKAARAASSSDPKSRGQESTAVKAAKAASSTSTSASETEDLYFDNIKGSHKEKPSKDDSNEDDDLYFDNRVKK